MAKQMNALPFYQRLVLNQFVIRQFGAFSFTELKKPFSNPALEEIQANGETGFVQALLLHFKRTASISENKVLLYDAHIVQHLAKINAHRDEKIRLKYFQWLSLMFVEYYLDRYFNDRRQFLKELNDYVAEYNQEHADGAIDIYDESDLNKIALWNATGSGKTILMHINYYQYLQYASLADDASIILLTPKEGLSLQHLADFEQDGIPASMYNKDKSRWFSDATEIQVLENTKLGEKDGDKTVAVSRFGNRNLLFVDEGHRGASGDTWYMFRNHLCEKGFSFEYSATFGQAVHASAKDDLVQEYAKCILLDYSYKFFYGDGYGKDYNIINITHDEDSVSREKYLTACLLSFYQQKKLYLNETDSAAVWNIDNPLFVFVGSSVNAVRKESKKDVSDVVDILLFFNAFFSRKKDFAAYIEQIISGASGLLDDKGHDIFAASFSYLRTLKQSAEAVYNDILLEVCNCQTQTALLHIKDVKGIDGEIALSLGDNDAFGLINVGDTSALIKLCRANGLEVSSADFGESLFQKIASKDSKINVLIGSKKFTEGWNCWRVSTMGLMNVGQSEGSEIIQLFGRGVRLRGYALSLKRSVAYKNDDRSVTIPPYLQLLETLNVFGVRAHYMQAFKEYLSKEDVSVTKDDVIQITLPVIRNTAALQKKLKILKLPAGIDYKKDAPLPILQFDEHIKGIVLDLYAHLQQENSLGNASVSEQKKNKVYLDAYLNLFDYTELWFALEQYKNEKRRYNAVIQKDNLEPILRQHDWYTLYMPEADATLRDFSDVRRLQNIALSLLKLYFDKLYSYKRSEWETPLLQYALLSEDDANLIDEYTVSVPNEPENQVYKETLLFIENLISEVGKAQKTGMLEKLTASAPLSLDSIAIEQHLYNPLLHLKGANVEISVSPISLVDSEYTFICDLRNYIKNNPVKFENEELYIIRNQSKKGLGIFADGNFYPDFILWLIKEEKQYITFIEPHGMAHESIYGTKAQLFRKLKDVEAKLNDSTVVLNSFILTPTNINDIDGGVVTREDCLKNHVLLMSDVNYVEQLFIGG